MIHQKFVHQDLNGNPWGIVTIEQMWEDKYILKYNKPNKNLNLEDWLNLFTLAKSKGIELGAKRMGLRVRLEYDADKIRNILSDLKFFKISGRIEYQLEVESLPDESGTPLIWKTAQQLNWTENEIANFTEKNLKNTLEDDPNDTILSFIHDWLNHEELTHGKDCIAVGFLNNQPAALVVAQVEMQTGWSRISWMSALPEFRNQNLGKWIHRHGFRMIKEQGGKLYHGSTHVDNKAMRKLFEKHACRFFCEIEMWEWTAEKETENNF